MAEQSLVKVVATAHLLKAGQELLKAFSMCVVATTLTKLFYFGFFFVFVLIFNP